MDDTIRGLLRCSITHEVPRDPVLSSEGHIYSRQAIEEWIKRSGTSPMTRAVLVAEDIKSVRIIESLCSAVYHNHQSHKSCTVMTAMKDVMKAAANAGAHIFGSIVFREQVLSPSIRAFYRECTTKQVSPSTVYKFPDFHPESYHARKFMPRDVDVFLPTTTSKADLLENIRGCMKFIQVTEITEDSSIYESMKLSNLSRYKVEVPGKKRGSCVGFGLDIISGRKLETGPFPNVMKMLVQDKVGVVSLSSVCGELGRVDEYFLGSLRTMTKTRVTVTPFLNAHSTLAFTGSASEVFSEIRTYFFRLKKELRDSWTFLNLSVKYESGVVLFTRAFDEDREVSGEWVHGAPIDLDGALESTPLFDLRRGRLMVPSTTETLVVHILCDPDFNRLSHEFLRDLT